MLFRNPIAPRLVAILGFLAALLPLARAGTITNITVSPSELVFKGSSKGGEDLVEAPLAGGTNLPLASLTRFAQPGPFDLKWPRFDGARDRVYSGFGVGLVSSTNPVRYVEDW